MKKIILIILHKTLLIKTGQELMKMKIRKQINIQQINLKKSYQSLQKKKLIYNNHRI
jgi:hypothetical protein